MAERFTSEQLLAIAIHFAIEVARHERAAAFQRERVDNPRPPFTSETRAQRVAFWEAEAAQAREIVLAALGGDQGQAETMLAKGREIEASSPRPMARANERRLASSSTPVESCTAAPPHGGRRVEQGSMADGTRFG